MNRDACVWCGAEVDDGVGFRAYGAFGKGFAAFCRLEHIVPWAIRGARWAPRAASGPLDGDLQPRCAHCAAQLGEEAVVLVRHRGAHRICDGFCSVEHMREWANAGGRWR